MAPVRHRVVDRRPELADTVTLTLAPVDAPLAPAKPGQFNMLWVFGVGEVPISIAGHDREGRLEHTVRSVGKVTEALCRTDAGAMVGARGPFGTGFDVERARGGHLLVIGGGIGLAPVRSVILDAIRDPGRFRHVTVLVGARTPDTLLYAAEFDRWRAAGIEVLPIVDSGWAGWNGDVGVVTTLIPRVLRDPASTTAVMCGPEVMIRFAARELIDRGVPDDAVQVSLERNMHCAVAMCGRCQLGPHFVCRNGPCFEWPQVDELLKVRER